MSASAPAREIVSIQSHVAYGHVGNSAAVFALQRLGHEAWPVHVLQYSNHPGYGDHAGEVLGAQHVGEVLRALGRRGVLARAAAVLTGYLPAPALVEAVAEGIDLARSQNPSLLVCCDPVIGDTGTGRFVPAGVAEALRDALVPRADVLVPNMFELGWLCGIDVSGRDAALGAARRLLATGPDTVIVTGGDGPHGQVETLLVESQAAWSILTPRIELGRRPDGAGDLLAATLVGRLVGGEGVLDALRHAVAATHDVIVRTRDLGARELALIEAQAQLLEPTCTPRVARIG